MNIQVPKGTKDTLPNQIYKWQYVEGVIKNICKKFNIKEIRTPVFEYTELFCRGVGDGTDIVQKEMYTFTDKGNRSITLRPEGTAGIVRSFIENNLEQELLPQKLYYILPMYRYENIQKGRYREFTQFGVEILGSKDVLADYQSIDIVNKLFKELELNDIELQINSIGCPECRTKYIDKLKEYLNERYDSLCTTCRTRYTSNTLRIFDCKESKCKSIIADAPKITDNLCDECNKDFEKLKEILTFNNIEYVVNPILVRGLDYYTKTVFEFVSNNIGSQGTICGGGRYDKLIETCGGKDTPAVGFAMGMDRLILEIDQQKIDIIELSNVDLYIGNFDNSTDKIISKLADGLRNRGYIIETNLMGRAVKAQMKYADKINAKYSCIIGQDEMLKGKVNIRNMQDATNNEVDIDIFEIAKILERGI